MSKSIPLHYNSQTAVDSGFKGLKQPSYLLELAYLGLLFYANLAPAFGVAIPLAGAGGLAVLVVLCLLHFGSNIVRALRPIKFALGCAFSIILLQLLVFHESPGHGWIRFFVTWTLSLLVIQSLSYRKGFFHRFALVAFFVGCVSLPFIKVYVSTGEMMRIGGDEGVALGNPNYFGMWFGFCAIYFLVTGLEAKNYIIRSASWAAGILCLFLMALTVSRGPLLGVAIAMVFAFEKVLKRSFLPVLGFLCFAWLILVSGVFDELIGYYMHRGAEESGRSRLWAWAIAGIKESWGLGVGLSNAFFVFEGDKGAAGPHNSVLFIWLSSGFLPLACYIVYLVQAGKGGLRARKQQSFDSPYVLPLVSFALLELMVLDAVFMSPWHMVVFSVAIGTARNQSKRNKPLRLQTPIDQKFPPKLPKTSPKLSFVQN
jgi:O-antigen ligase